MIADVAPTVRYLDFDSAFWNLQMFHVDEAVEPPHADFLQTLMDASNFQLALRYGFTPVDIRVTLDRKTAFGLAPLDVRLYEPDDLDALVRIARESHRITRYYADPGFPNERCHDLYETWIRNSVEGWADAVLVAGRPAHGYVTVHAEPGGTASIGLIAVDKAARGQGAGQRLVHGAVRYAHSAGCQRMTVVTQGRNIDAQRVFQRCGFLTCATEVWLHKHLR